MMLLVLAGEKSGDGKKKGQTYDLTGSGGTACQNLSSQRNSSRLFICELPADEIVDGEFDGLFRSDSDKLRQNTRVQPTETLIPNDLACAIYRVLVQALTRTCASLILHPRLNEVDGVHHESTKGASDTAQAKMVRGFKQAVEKLLRT